VTATDVPSEWTPDDVDGELQRLATCVVRLGTVDYGDLVRQDETPATGHTRVTTLVNAAGMLGSLAMAAMVPMEDLFAGMVAAALAGSVTTTEGDVP
jgi:hypothetical protein